MLNIKLTCQTTNKALLFGKECCGLPKQLK
jgi:tRNA(Leu) C34 or U34 (ribose-2'-O)-methylase TrmL